LLAALLASIPAPAAFFQWTNTAAGNFVSAANWTNMASPFANGVPGSADSATNRIAGSTTTIGVGDSVTVVGLGAQAGTISVTGGSLTATTVVSSGSNSVFSVSGGTVSLANLQITGNYGVISNSGGTVTVTTDSRVAVANAVWNVTGGTLNLSKLTIGSAASSNTNNVMTVSGNAIVTQTQGTGGGAARELWLGGNNAGSGTVILKDNATWTNSAASGSTDVIIGRAASAGQTPVGILTIQDNASMVVQSGAAVAKVIQMAVNSTAATGTLNLNGGSLSTIGVTRSSGTATVNAAGGKITALTNQANFFANFPGTGGNNSINLQSGGLKFDTAGFAVSITNVLSGAGGLTKLGAGTLTISAANTYSGDIVVSNGTLVSSTRSIGAGAAIVADAATLEVQVAALGKSLTNSSLTLGTSGNVTNLFTLGVNASTTVPAVVVTGALTVNGTVTVNVTGTALAGSTYPLIGYDSSSGSGSFVLGSVPAVGGYTASITNNPTSKQIELVYTPLPLPAIKWAVGDGNWDTATANWKLIADDSVTNYVEGAKVTLDDSASGSSPITVTLTADRGPTIITNNSTKTYIIAGGFTITNASLVKADTGTLVLDNGSANSFAGVSVSAGTLQVGNNDANGSLGSAAVLNNGSLAFNRTDNPAVANVISGSGSVVQNGSGTVTLGSANTYSGDTVVNSGRLLLANANAAQNSTVSNTVAEGLGFSGITTATIGGLTGSGSVVLTNTAGAAVTLTAGGNNASTEYSGALSGAASVLHKTGTGTLTLSGTVSGLNNLDVSSGPGTLAVSGGTVTTTNMQVNVVDGVIAISGGSVSVPTDARISASGGAMNISGGTHHFNKIVVANNSGTANATVTVSGNAQMIQDGSLTTGNADRQLWVGGNNNATSGSLTLKDNASWINNQSLLDDLNGNPMVVVGNIGNCQGTLTIQDNATFSYTNLLRVARLVGNVGTVNLNGGTVSVTGFERQAGTGTVNADGGKVIALANSANFFQNFTGTGGDNNNSVNLLAGGLTFDSGAFTVTVGNVLAGTGGLTKIGNGTLNLNGVNTYTGDTVVNDGRLGGNGTIAGNLTVAAGGTLGAGTSIGTLTVGGAATLAGTVVAEIAAGPSADLINFAGGASLGGTLTVTSTGGLVNGQTFNLFDGSLSGSFGTVNLPGGAVHWNTSALYTSGEITLFNNAPVAADFTSGVAIGGSALTTVIGKYATDADVGDVVTITAVTPPVNGTVSIVGGTNLLYTSTNSAAGDSFTYTVSDGLSSVTATVTVQTYSPAGFNKLSGPTIVGAGPDYSISYLGVPNEDYALDETSSLTPPITWTPVVTNTASGMGGLEFIFTPANPSGFIRTRHVP